VDPVELRPEFAASSFSPAADRVKRAARAPAMAEIFGA
jgi:hypothetical protein